MSPRVVVASLLVLSVAIPLIREGVKLIGFESIEATTATLLKELTADPDARRKRQKQIEDTLALLRPWTAEPGVAVRARLATASLNETMDDLVRAESSVVDLLTVDPASGGAWLALARLRWRRAEPFTRTQSALIMSQTIAPREAGVMSARLAFVLGLWELLPPNEQRFAINQLMDLGEQLEPKTKRRLRDIISAKPKETREALRSELATRGGDRSKSWTRDIGL